MSMISEQVNYLRVISSIMQDKDWKNAVGQAADTIEELSAKLQAANMENGGGWISCEDRLPEESGYYDVTIESKINDEIVRTTDYRCFHKDNELWAELTEPEFSIEETVIAWKHRPEPYRP